MDDSPATLLAGIAAGLLVVLPVLVYFGQERCPQCQERGTIRWRHQARRGGPDRRYRDNPRECRRCGYVSGQEVVSPPTGPAARAPIVADTMAALQRLIDQNLAEAGDLPVQHLIRLLKYVAIADRRFRDEERRTIIAAVATFFPGRLPDERVAYWLDLWDPEHDKLAGYVEPFLTGPPELREALVAAIEAVAVADGKATKSERERIAAIRAALGLAESPPER
jgi:hypothetical protein